MLSSYNIFNKSCTNMVEIKDGGAQLVFTSPPYWDLKDYDIEGQIGHKQTYEDYLEEMAQVWRECERILTKTGVLAININDRVSQGVYYPIHLDFFEQLKKVGFRYFELAVWHKASGVPTAGNKLTDRFEYIILSSKSKIIKKDFQYNDYKNSKLGNILSWHIIKKAGSILKNHPHPAFFPPELACRGIELFTKKDDLVVDPFLGVGNTMNAAYASGRRCTGYEINPVYIKTALDTLPKEMKIRVKPDLDS